MSVAFHNTSNLKLEVETTPAGLPNLFPDPDGVLGAWPFFVTDPGLGTGQDTLTSDGTKFTYTNVNSADGGNMIMRGVPVPAAAWFRMRYTVTSITAGHTLRIQYVFYRADGVATGSSGGWVAPTVTGGVSYGPLIQAPALTSYAVLSFLIYKGASQVIDVGATVSFNQVMVTYSMVQADVSGTFAVTQPVTWANILAPTHSIDIERGELELGVLNARIIDAALDPAVSAALALGNAVRCRADVGGGVFESLFEGEISDVDVTYSRDRETGVIRTSIQLEAVDGMATLANTGARDSFAGSMTQQIANLERAGYGLLPWNVNGNKNRLPNNARVPVAFNDDATTLDQIVLTRDSVSGYAWISRQNIFTAYDPGSMPAGVACTFSDVDSALATREEYSDITAGWNTEEAINQVLVTWLRNVAGTTEEITYGPYTDDVWARKGTRQKTFTITGATEDPAAISAFAKGVIAANKTPVRKASMIKMPVRDTRSMKHATQLDLYDLCGVEFAALINSSYRITSIKHKIDTDGWVVEYGFAVNGAVASPAAAPAPGVTDTSDGTWIAPALGAAWVNFGSTWETAGYMRAGGVIYLRGLIKSGTVTAGTVLFTLPVGYRPSSDKHMDTVSNGVHAVLNVMANGQVKINASVSASYLSLAGIIFRAEQ